MLWLCPAEREAAEQGRRPAAWGLPARTERDNKELVQRGDTVEVQRECTRVRVSSSEEPVQCFDATMDLQPWIARASRIRENETAC